MYLEKLKENGQKFKVIVRGVTETRLKNKCFRSGKKLAGNFSSWRTEAEVLGNPIVLERILEHAEASLQKGIPTNSVCIDLGCTLGWESTDPVKNYEPDALETFTPNRASTAKKVKLERKDLLAPKTSKLSIVYEVKDEFGICVIIVHTMYPGEYVGKLEGDITSRENRVFFDWDHPGA